MKVQAKDLLADLPTDCTKGITQYCDLNTILILTKVNTELRAIATSDEIWETMIKGNHREEISRFFQKNTRKIIRMSIEKYNKSETIENVIENKFPKPQLSPIETIRKLKGKCRFFTAFCNTNKQIISSKLKTVTKNPELIFAIPILLAFSGSLLLSYILELPFIHSSITTISSIFIVTPTAMLWCNKNFTNDPRKTRRDIVDILKRVNESKQTLVFTDANNIDPDSGEDPCDPFIPNWD